MKRILSIMGIFLTILFLFVSSASAITWLTYREDIAINTGYVDINQNMTLGYEAPETANGLTSSRTWNETFNITLPTNIDNLTLLNVTVFNQDTDEGLGFNLSINNWVYNTSTLIDIDGDEHYIDLGELKENNTEIKWDCFINITFNATKLSNQLGANCSLNLTIEETDATLDSTWLNATGRVATTEYDLVVPAVTTSLGSSFFTINDSCNITSNLAKVNLTNLVFNITYPDHAIGTPPTTTFNFSASNLWDSSVNNINGSEETYVQYQKRGPYTYSIDEEVTGSDHEVTIYIKAEETLTNCVDWTIDPDDDFYDGFFDTVDNASLVIELNNVDIDDWERDGTDIILEDFTVRTTYTLNEFVFTWTVPAVIPPAVPPISLTTIVFFLPIWLWVTIIVVILVAAVAIYKQYQK